MRVLIANSNQAIVGGIEQYLQILIPALLRRGHEIGLIFEHAAGPSQSTVHPRQPDVPVWLWPNSQASAGIPVELADWKPDVVYMQGSQSLDVEEILQVTYPAVLYAHVYHGTCATGRKCHAFPQPRPCTRTFGPMCLVLHYPRRCGGLNPITALQSYQYQKRRHELLKGYRSILVASASMYREFEQHGVERDRLNLVPLPNTGTVETETHSPNLDAQTARILFVGRLTDLKGVDHLIRSIPEAARKLGRRVLLTVAGDGPERSRLENLARTIGTPVEFRGWVDSDAKIELMHQSDLLAVPSLWPEPFGLVGLEAGSLGLPAVGYSSGGIPDWLMPGQTGELAPSDPPTIQGLSNAIVRALEYPEHYAQLCRGARELARQFSTERHLSKLEAALQAACSNESDRKATIDLTIGNGVTQ